MVLQKERGDKGGVADTLLNLGYVAAASSSYSRSVCLISAAETMQRSIGAMLEKSELSLYDVSLKTAPRELGETEFEALWIKGSSLSFGEAIAFALEEIAVSTSANKIAEQK